MKIIFGYYDDEDFGLTEYPELIFPEKSGKENNEERSEDENKMEEYRKYLITGIMEDFQYPESCEEVLNDIREIENGKKFEAEWDGQAFQHKISKFYVQFTHTIFGECEEYPVWSCRLREYRKVLQVWKSFLGLPKSLESKIETNI